MQEAWSRLLLTFCLAALQVMASLMQTAAMTPPTPSTMVTMTSANPTATESSGFPEIIVDPAPTIPTLTVISDWKAVAPTPGSVVILDDVQTRIPNNTTEQTAPVLADTADTEYNSDPFQPWNTSYPGPIHEGDWLKYLQIWDPVWWSQNLDSLRQTSCTCSAKDFYTNPQAQLAAYMNFEYYSHNLGNIYAFDWACGPTRSAMSIKERITSGKGLSEHCWSMAGGEFPDDRRAQRMDDIYYCDESEEVCVKPWRYSKRSLTFHGHKRNFDRDGVHRWSEVAPVVRDVCEPICRDKFLMLYDDFSHHNPSFVTTWYPPKPIDLTVVGD